MARETAATEGRDGRARNFDRLLAFPEEQLADARSGVLPRRGNYGFALTRYADEYEWGTEGETMLVLIHELQRIWGEQPRD